LSEEVADVAMGGGVVWWCRAHEGDEGGRAGSVEEECGVAVGSRWGRWSGDSWEEEVQELCYRGVLWGGRVRVDDGEEEGAVGEEVGAGEEEGAGCGGGKSWEGENWWRYGDIDTELKTRGYVEIPKGKVQVICGTWRETRESLGQDDREQGARDSKM